MKTLRQAVVNKNSIHVFEVDDVSAVFEVITHVDGANAGQTVKGCNDLQASFCGAGQCQLGLGDLLSGSAFVKCAAADEILCHQLGIAGVVGLGNIELGLGLLNLCGGQLVVKLNQ